MSDGTVAENYELVRTLPWPILTSRLYSIILHDLIILFKYRREQSFIEVAESGL
jgi:hypothetical protein